MVAAASWNGCHLIYHVQEEGETRVAESQGLCGTRAKNALETEDGYPMRAVKLPVDRADASDDSAVRAS